MSETPSMQTRKPRPSGPRQCPTCHRDLWEPCLDCRQTGLQQPTIVWCPECGQPGRGEYCRKCGAKLHAPPVCRKCDGLGWLPIRHGCLPEPEVAPVPGPPQRSEAARGSRDELLASVRRELDGRASREVYIRHLSASRPVDSADMDAEGGRSQGAGLLRAVFVIVLVLIFACYVMIYGYTGW
jgi:hypothetical protein